MPTSSNYQSTTRPRGSKKPLSLSQNYTNELSECQEWQGFELIVEYCQCRKIDTIIKIPFKRMINPFF